jgi:predicted ArsR family transcriptional regulator
VAPSPAVVANRLGISTQVAAQPVYLTTGRSRDIKVGRQTFRFKHTAPGRLADTDSVVGLALQALDAVGPNADERALQRIRESLTARQQAELIGKARYTPGRVSEAARKLTAKDQLSHG